MQYRKFSVFALFAVIVITLSLVCSASAAYTRFDSSDGVGIEDVFSVNDEVYARAENIPAGTYTVNVVVDVIKWEDGMDIPDPVNTPVAMVIPSSSGVYFEKVWSSAQPGMYDIVADLNNNGVYDAGIDRIDSEDIGINVDSAGLLVVPEYVLGGLAAVGAAFVAFAVVKRKAIHL